MTFGEFNRCLYVYMFKERPAISIAIKYPFPSNFDCNKEVDHQF